MGQMGEFISANFLHVAPILAAAGFAVVIILERVNSLVFLFPMRNMPAFLDRIRDHVMGDRLSEALLLCEQFRAKPAAAVVKESLLRAHQPEDLIEEGVHIQVVDATARIQARTAFLGTIANVSTLLGLLGTIVGLIRSFEAVGSASAQQKSALLAAGISTAMNATMMGLAVAIPCMVVYSFLMSRTAALLVELEQTAARMMDMIKQRYYEADQEPFKTSGRQAG